MTKVSDAQLKKAITDADGVLSVAARALGIDRKTVYNRLEKSLELAEAVEEARESLTDVAENELGKAIRAGNLTAIIFHLKASPTGRKRGYNERMEVSGPDGGPIAHVDVTKLSDDELRKLAGDPGTG